MVTVKVIEETPDDPEWVRQQEERERERQSRPVITLSTSRLIDMLVANARRVDEGKEQHMYKIAIGYKKYEDGDSEVEVHCGIRLDRRDYLKGKDVEFFYPQDFVNGGYCNFDLSEVRRSAHEDFGYMKGMPDPCNFDIESLSEEEKDELYENEDFHLHCLVDSVTENRKFDIFSEKFRQMFTVEYEE